MAWYAKFDGVDGEIVSTGRSPEGASGGHTGGANFAMCDGSVRLDDTSVVATLIDFEHSDGVDDGLLLPAVQESGLLLPAVQVADGSHAQYPDLI